MRWRRPRCRRRRPGAGQSDGSPLSTRETVFGETDEELERLPPTFRTHGSLHEIEIPLVIFNASGALPDADQLHYNFDMTRNLYRDPK